MNNDALVILSGGQDSTTVLFLALQTYDRVHALTIDYGQRHSREIEAAQNVWGVARGWFDNTGEHEVVKLPSGILKSTSPLVDVSQQVAQYVDADALPGGVEKTFVPMRNTLFLTLAANRAIALGAENVLTGICEEDYGGYPDCRSEYLTAMQDAVDRSTDGLQARVRFYAPLMHLSKKQIAKLGARLDSCGYALAWSHTCYKGETPPCGQCHACLLRARGFAEAGLEDPLLKRLREKDPQDPMTPGVPWFPQAKDVLP